MPEPNAVARRLLLALIGSFALVAAAPWFGILRSELRAALPGRFSLVVNAIVAVAVVAAIVTSHVKSGGRWWRYGLWSIALAVAAAYDVATGSADPAIRAVERIHFVQYGLITFLFYRVWRERGDGSVFVLPFCAAFVVGVAEEGYQWFLPARVGELEDVWLNSVAIGCGLLFSIGAAPPAGLRARWAPGSAALVRRAAALALLAIAAFVHVVHLGVAIDDPAIGRFVSYYTAPELAARDAARAAEWAAAPPLVRPPRFSREDQFMTEGLQHAQARNKAWTAGRYDEAWRENLILERYYPTVLKTPSYVAKQGHTWPVEQRADAERRADGPGQVPFVSAAYPYPIYTWSPIVLWSAALLAAAALLGLGRLSVSPSTAPTDRRS